MGKVIFSLCVSVHTSTGGGTRSQVQVGGGIPGLGGGVPGPGGGVPGPGSGRGGPRSRSRGVPSLRSGGGVPGLRSRGGILVSVEGKNFDTRFGLIHVQTGEKNFC